MPLDNGTLRSRRPLSFRVTFDRESRLYAAEGPFDITAASAGRQELESEIAAELAMLWREYALASPASLTSAARRLQEELLASFEVVPRAV